MDDMNNPTFGITIGDASGVGAEILLKAFANGEIPFRFVAYGDLAALRYYNELLRYGVELQGAGKYNEGALNVVDQALLQAGDITPGKLNKKAGHAAR